MSRDNLKPQTSKREGDLSFVAGGYFSHGGVFSENVEYIYLCAGPSIKVYRLENATLVGILVGHIDTVTSVLCDKSDKSNVISSSLDPKTYFADVVMSIRRDVKIPEDTSVAVSSEGLLGGTFLSLSPGGSDEMLQAGGEITMTQGSIDLMGLLGQMIFSQNSKSDGKDQ